MPEVVLYQPLCWLAGPLMASSASWLTDLLALSGACLPYLVAKGGGGGGGGRVDGGGGRSGALFTCRVGRSAHQSAMEQTQIT